VEFDPGMIMDQSRILTFFGRIGSGLGFSAGPDRSRIVMSRVCQLKYAMPRPGDSEVIFTVFAGP